MTAAGKRTPKPLERADFDAVCDLLVTCSLPTGDLEAARMTDFLGIFENGALVASGGLEMAGREDALLRSLAVDPSARGRGLGARIVAGLEAQANKLGAQHVYLLTEDADGYFERLGYRRVARANAPTAIAQTTQFARLCPDNAVLLGKQVGPG